MNKRNFCNKKLLDETTAATGETSKTVSDIIEWQSRFLASTIKSGAFEAVKVSGFGVFRAKLRTVQLAEYFKSVYNKENSTRIISKEL